MLTDLLEIDAKLLKFEHSTALGLADRAWLEAGKPTSSEQLIQFIEKVLIACEQCGYEYPPILLRRKKEMIRGTWQPRVQAPKQAQAERTVQCFTCGDTGWEAVPYPGSAPSYRPCACGKVKL